MADHPDGLVTFEAAGEKFTAVFGFKAMKAIEAHYDKPFFKAIQSAMPDIRPEDAGDKAKLAEASANIRFSDIGALFGFALLRHHPDLTEEAIEDLIDDVGLEKASEVIGMALTAALVKEGDAGSSTNPPKGRRAK
jgi:hypothetical protein